MRFAVLLAGTLSVMLAVVATTQVFTSSKAEEPVVQRNAGVERLASLEQRVADNPEDVDGYTQLAAAYLQRVRESADPSFYELADRAVARALELRADDPNALVVAGTIAASKHDFVSALEFAERAHDAEPRLIAAYSVRVDALIELGRYDEALAAAQEMADLRPDFAALSRISYLRELHGDLDGAITAMQAAADAGTGVREDRVWALVHVGLLELTNGRIDHAEAAFDEATALLPADPVAHFGQAKLAIARQEFAVAEQELRSAVAQRPAPEYLIALGDVLAAQGRSVEAEEQYATVRAIQQLFAVNGADTDIELIAFDTDYGSDPGAAYAAARAVYERRPSVTVADAVAWAAYKAGDVASARTYMELALRLGTADARFAYHAAVIAEAAGDGPGAEAHRRAADSMIAALPPAYAADLQQRMAVVGE